jgi:hypothetical protein
MDEPIDTAALDALMARTREACRELAEVVRQSREIQSRSRSLREWWAKLRAHPSAPLSPRRP